MAFLSLFLLRFSLILSKITITSLIPYAITVNTEIMKIVSTCNVSFMSIHTPYAHIVANTSNSITHSTTADKTAGEMYFLISLNANSIYITINISQINNACIAVVFIYSHTLGPVNVCPTISSLDVMYPSFTRKLEISSES